MTTIKGAIYDAEITVSAGPRGTGTARLEADDFRGNTTSIIVLLDLVGVQRLRAALGGLEAQMVREAL